MNNANKEIIKLYAKQLRTPSFNRYDNIIRQLSSEDGYKKYLIELMKQELFILLNWQLSTKYFHRIKL